jgi:S-adenosylmethionine:tRNA ribosyltransferase-isomerase
MKILLIGEYSNVHWTLAEGLRALGHDVTVASEGDDWKNYPRDIDLRREGLGSNSLLKRLKGTIRFIGKVARIWPQLRGYDVVQLINPVFLDFRNVLDYFDEDDTFIFNDTQVFPARLYGTKEKTDAKIEVFLLRELNEELRLWDVLVEPARKIRIGNKLFFEEDGPMVAEVIDNTTSRGRTLRFLYDCPHDEFKRELFALGEAPLPRYVVDKRPATPEDMDNFQTIYARNEGAVTAPSTGLHFSRELMKRMEIKGINFAYVTLHCGLGNFDSIEVEDLTKHKMNSEQVIIRKEACDIVNKTKEAGHRVCVVGVSTARATETAVGTDGQLKEFDGWTNKFIFPPYDFGLSNALIGNF